MLEGLHQYPTVIYMNKLFSAQNFNIWFTTLKRFTLFALVAQKLTRVYTLLLNNMSVLFIIANHVWFFIGLDKFPFKSGIK